MKGKIQNYCELFLNIWWSMENTLREIFTTYENEYLKKFDNKKSYDRYKYVLDVYGDYIEEKCSSTINISKYMNTVNTEDLIEATKKYVSFGSVKSQDTIDFLKSAFIEFHKFIKEKYGYDGDVLHKYALNKTDPDSFMFKYNNYCNDLLKRKIISKGEGKIYDDNSIKIILECCNKNLEINFPKQKQENRCYDQYVKSLIIKLIIYTGVSVVSKLYPIKVNDYDMKRGSLKIGNYIIHLPYYLRQQFNDYMNEIVGCREKNDYLFKLYNGTKLEDAHDVVSIYSHSLSKQIEKGYTSTTAIAKYAIMQLVDAGVDRDTIQDFTGYGDNVYLACKDLIFMGRKGEKEKIIDPYLMSTQMYDIL